MPKKGNTQRKPVKGPAKKKKRSKGKKRRLRADEPGFSPPTFRGQPALGSKEVHEENARIARMNRPAQNRGGRGRSITAAGAVAAANSEVDGNGLRYQACLLAPNTSEAVRVPDLTSFPTGVRTSRAIVRIPMVQDSVVTSDWYGGLLFRPRTKDAYQVLSSVASGAASWGIAIDMPGQASAEVSQYAARIVAQGITAFQSGLADNRGGTLVGANVPNANFTDLTQFFTNPKYERTDGQDVTRFLATWRPLNYDNALHFDAPTTTSTGPFSTGIIVIFRCSADVAASAAIDLYLTQHTEFISLPTMASSGERTVAGSEDAASKAEDIVDRLAGSMNSGASGPSTAGGGGPYGAGPAIDAVAHSKPAAENIASKIFHMGQQLISGAERAWGMVQAATKFAEVVGEYAGAAAYKKEELSKLLHLHFVAVGSYKPEMSPFFRSTEVWQQIHAAKRGSGQMHLSLLPRYCPPSPPSSDGGAGAAGPASSVGSFVVPNRH